MTDSTSYPRRDWPRLFLSLPPQQITEAVRTLTEPCRVDDQALPQSGLALLQLRDGALAEPYYIGETPLSRAQVTVIDKNGKKGAGAAQILDDRASLARDVAILDAMLANRLNGHETIEHLLEEGALRLARSEASRRVILDRTRVDFALLEETAEDDEI
ncbi:MAG: phosphonate C-P lyase system protein PhnG [Xanthomonadales bacterium]|nr:phosphonate C-P lyase system protein PhnG [bacterium]MDT8321205.1 phosphonate C-P lyase system protein PhnG [Xanthomonadales bacterium]